MRILLAEDNAIVRKAVAADLMADGYDVDVAEDGEHAITLAHSVHPDLIISDVLMPNMDGFSLCQAVRSDDALNDVPVVFYSSTFLEPEDEELARHVGASGFILKNGDRESFHQKLQEMIEARKDRKSPRFEKNPEHLEDENDLHQRMLIRKLLRKVDELEVGKRALRENRQLLDDIVTTIPDIVFVMLIPDMAVSFIAPNAERLLGYAGDEFVNASDKWKTLIFDEDVKMVEQEIRQAVRHKGSTIITCRMKHKEGGVRWVEAHVTPRFNDEGVPIELIGSLSDVTERFEREEKIRQNERRLDVLLGNLPGMAYRCENRRDWKMEFVSDGVEKLTGYRRNEVEHNNRISYADLIHPDDREMVWNEVQRAIARELQFSLVYRLLHRDGSVRWVWERGVGIGRSEDGVQYIEGFVSDITLRKQAEEKLIKSEQRFRGLFEMMDSGMSLHELIYDESGKAYDYRFLDVNPAFERLTGLSKKDVVGRSVREAIPGIEEEWITDYIKVAQNGGAAGFVRYSAPLGRSYQVVAYQTQKDQFVTIFTDVSEQLKAEEEIHNLARFPEENPSPVIRVSESGEVMYQNPASKILLGECQTKHDGFCSAMIVFAKEALAENVQKKVEYTIGESHYSFVITPVKESGYANLYGRDVTKRVNATQQLERTNHVLRTLSQGNRSMIHATSEGELLQRVCRVLAEEGNYPFVWAAYADDEDKLSPQFECGEFSEQMRPWFEELPRTNLSAPLLSGLFEDSTPLLLSELEEGGWTKRQVEIVQDSDVSILLLLPLIYRKTIFGVIGIFSATRDIFDSAELSLLQEMAGDVSYGIQSQRTHIAHEQSMARIQKTMLQTIEAVSLTLEKRDPYTAGHQQRVVQLAVAIATEMGMTKQHVEGLRLAALVHDLGKIHVPAEILNRPGRLSESEFGIIKSHPQVGYDILKGVEFDWPIADIVLQHHERCDGSGYPQGLFKEQIIPEARILAVADVVEAITSHRPYRPGLGIDSALKEVERGRATIYDEDVVDTCLKLFREKDFTWTDSITPLSA